MQTAGTYQSGQEAEAKALRWIQSRYPDWRLITKNFRTRRGEIDLVFEQPIASGGSYLVFVEVRLRSVRSWVSAAESVTFSKRKRLELAAQTFLLQYSGRAIGARFAVWSWDGVQSSLIMDAWNT